MNATTVAVDLAKNVFEIAIADQHWKVGLPLSTIGALVTQIPCRHGTYRSHIRCRIYDCKRNPLGQLKSIRLFTCGRSPYTQVRCHPLDNAQKQSWECWHRTETLVLLR